ncbi:unnamed protein product [Caenorhabditis bovis]|uniref:Uncharacterized protein n=1 Tax=Caenorhabditis bovis TaxID=2654633 RepID=A0A8S1F584_9PELO|nr:unnamed protein product [Caenorhabditis bovis]
MNDTQDDTIEIESISMREARRRGELDVYIKNAAKQAEKRYADSAHRVEAKLNGVTDFDELLRRRIPELANPTRTQDDSQNLEDSQFAVPALPKIAGTKSPSKNFSQKYRLGAGASTPKANANSSLRIFRNLNISHVVDTTSLDPIAKNVDNITVTVTVEELANDEIENKNRTFTIEKCPSENGSSLSDAVGRTFTIDKDSAASISETPSECPPNPTANPECSVNSNLSSTNCQDEQGIDVIEGNAHGLSEEAGNIESGEAQENSKEASNSTVSFETNPVVHISVQELIDNDKTVVNLNSYESEHFSKEPEISNERVSEEIDENGKEVVEDVEIAEMDETPSIRLPRRAKKTSNTTMYTVNTPAHDSVDMDITKNVTIDDSMDQDSTVLNINPRKNDTVMVLKARKIIAPVTPEPGLRRSTRHRVKPLRSWLGEKAVYEHSPSGGQRLKGITEVRIKDKKMIKYRSADPKIIVERRQEELARKRARAAQRREKLALDHSRGVNLHITQDDIEPNSRAESTGDESNQSQHLTFTICKDSSENTVETSKEESINRTFTIEKCTPGDYLYKFREPKEQSADEKCCFKSILEKSPENPDAMSLESEEDISVDDEDEEEIDDDSNSLSDLELSAQMNTNAFVKDFDRTSY